MSEIVTRKEALERGLSRYFTGKPCANGHISERMVNNNRCRACRKSQLEEWKKANPERMAEYVRKSTKKNWHENKSQKLAIRRQKTKENPGFRARVNLSSRLRAALDGRAKSKCTMELLGCTIPELEAHIEAQFQKGMSWENMGLYGWHIDHIRPCASFDLTDPEQQRQCFHYTNLQPLWAEDNLRKGAGGYSHREGDPQAGRPDRRRPCHLGGPPGLTRPGIA